MLYRVVVESNEKMHTKHSLQHLAHVKHSQMSTGIISPLSASTLNRKMLPEEIFSACAPIF